MTFIAIYRRDQAKEYYESSEGRGRETEGKRGKEKNREGERGRGGGGRGGGEKVILQCDGSQNSMRIPHSGSKHICKRLKGHLLLWQMLTQS